MLINSSNTGKERKETGFFHWLEKMASGQVTKKKPKITQEEETLYFLLEIHI